MLCKLTIVNRYNTLKISWLGAFNFSKNGVLYYQFLMLYLGISSVRGCKNMQCLPSCIPTPQENDK